MDHHQARRTLVQHVGKNNPAPVLHTTQNNPATGVARRHVDRSTTTSHHHSQNTKSTTPGRGPSPPANKNNPAKEPHIPGRPNPDVNPFSTIKGWQDYIQPLRRDPAAAVTTLEHRNVVPKACASVTDWGGPTVVIDIRGPQCRVVDGNARQYMDFPNPTATSPTNSRVVMWEGGGWGRNVLCAENVDTFCQWLADDTYDSYLAKGLCRSRITFIQKVFVPTNLV